MPAAQLMLIQVRVGDGRLEILLAFAAGARSCLVFCILRMNSPRYGRFLGTFDVLDADDDRLDLFELRGKKSDVRAQIRGGILLLEGAEIALLAAPEREGSWMFHGVVELLRALSVRQTGAAAAWSCPRAEDLHWGLRLLLREKLGRQVDVGDVLVPPEHN